MVGMRGMSGWMDEIGWLGEYEEVGGWGDDGDAV